MNLSSSLCANRVNFILLKVFLKRILPQILLTEISPKLALLKSSFTHTKLQTVQENKFSPVFSTNFQKQKRPGIRRQLPNIWASFCFSLYLWHRQPCSFLIFPPLSLTDNILLRIYTSYKHSTQKTGEKNLETGFCFLYPHPCLCNRDHENFSSLFL